MARRELLGAQTRKFVVDIDSTRAEGQDVKLGGTVDESVVGRPPQPLRRFRDAGGGRR